MNIVQIADSITVGGAERQLVVFASMARAHDLNVTIVCLLEEPGELSYRDELTALGSRVVYFPSLRFFDWKRFNELKKFLRHGGFDLAHTHLIYGNIIGVMAAHLAGLPVVSTLHSTGRPKTSRARLREMLETWCLRYISKHVIAVGYMVEEAHRLRFGRKKMDILLNGVPPGAVISDEKRASLRREMSGDRAGPILFTAGRFAQPKALHHMVDAFAKIQPDFPQSTLVIAGDGPLFNEVSLQIQNLHLESSIRLLGARSDVPALLAASDVYVNSSIWEGLPMAILEAMMTGLPIIATQVGDIPRVVTREAGMVVPPGDPTSLATAMRTLLSEPETRMKMGQSARRRAMENYLSENWMNRLFELYKETVGK